MLQSGGTQGFGDGHLHRVELVIAGHLLDQSPVSVVLEHDEVTHQRQEAVPRTGALQHHLKFGHVRVGQGLARDCPPRLEPLTAGRERSDTGLDAIGDHEDLVHGEQSGEFRLVGLELLPSGPDRRVFVRRVLEFNHAQRQTVDEQHDVQSASILVFRDSELIDSQPVIVGGILEIDDTDLCAPNRAVGSLIFDRHPFH